MSQTESIRAQTAVESLLWRLCNRASALATDCATLPRRSKAALTANGG